VDQNGKSRIPEILQRDEKQLLADWVKEQTGGSRRRDDRILEAEIREQSAEFLRLLREATQNGSANDAQSPEWQGLRAMLADVSRSRVQRGFTPSETATFVFSLKKPLFDRLRQALAADGESLIREIWTATLLLDQLGLWTTEVYQKTREELIARQQEEMLELSTPVVKLWGGILALPIIGTLDSARTQVVMENLLQRIVETEAEIAIIDITGVPTVDTVTAQHLLKTVTAARLMGADCIISGIRPQIAQTIVHLGVDLGPVITKTTLADAFALALQRTGRAVTRRLSD
jgi:rsbT co-antagonist protein RsbR